MGILLALLHAIFEARSKYLAAQAHAAPVEDDHEEEEDEEDDRPRARIATASTETARERPRRARIREPDAEDGLEEDEPEAPRAARRTSRS
jgi:hypothetical protein